MDAALKHKFDFQTPIYVAKHMVSMIPKHTVSVLEPTPGIGNILNELISGGYVVTAPDNYFELDKNNRYDCIVMNPPFSSKYAYGVPDELNKIGMALGYHILSECLTMSNRVIALMPWFTLSDSDVRLRSLKRFGIKSVTLLPRKTFQYARVQTVIIDLAKGWREDTVFKVFDTKDDNHILLFK